MPYSTEQEQFAARLQSALRDVGIGNDSFAQVCRYFNHFSPHGNVSVSTVRKWLRGEAIPTQPSIVVLAKMLGVSPNWLRFGEPAATDPHPGTQDATVQPGALGLMKAYRMLDETERCLLDHFAMVLLDSRHPRVPRKTP